jgi:CheY-like chemotaxis protein
LSCSDRALTDGKSPEQHRFIFITGETREEIQQLCTKGLTRMIAKPFMLETLEQAVLAVLAEAA